MVVISHVLYSKMEQFICVLVLIGAIITCTVVCDHSNYDVVKLCDPADVHCVMDYFSKNGHCSVVSEPKKKETYEIDRPLFVPSFNITAVAPKSIISNFHGIVQNLHMDKKTGNLVMAVKFEHLSVFSPDMIIAVSQEGKEPRVIRDDMNATYRDCYPDSSYTSFQWDYQRFVKNSNYFAYFPFNNATLTSGSRFAQSTDPAIKAAYEAFRADVPTTLQELFQTEASFEFLVYLQNCICDFGLSPVLKDYDTTVLSNIVSDHDHKRDVFKPCARMPDLRECVSHFFAKQSHCTIANHPYDEPLVRDKVVIDVPKINSSVVPINSQLFGLNGTLNDFFVNLRTGNLVMSVKFEDIKMNSPVTHLVMNRPGQEPHVITGHNTASYPVTITAVIPIIEGISAEYIKKAYISAYISQPSQFQLGQNFTKSNDNSNSDNSETLCQSGNIECVRKYFSENGHCSVVKNAKKTASYEKNLPLFVPSVDVTAISIKTTISNMDGVIEDFRMDHESGKLVMAVKFQGLTVNVPDAIVAISRKGEEPKVIRDELEAKFPMILTAVIPASNGIDEDSLKNANYFAYFPNDNATLIPGKNYSTSEDPVIKASYQAFKANIPTVIQEIFKTEASFDFLVYLQNYICDFGLSPVLKEYDPTVLTSLIDSNDDKDKLSKPCDQNSDVRECVAKYFAQRSQCSIVKQPSNEPLSREKVPIPVPKINSSVILLDSYLTGLNGNLDEFYMNSDSGNLVMSVKFGAVKTGTSQAELVMNRPGQEPHSITDSSSKTTYAVTITAVIPVSQGISAESIKNAYISAYVPLPNLFLLGPKFITSSDPQVIQILFDVLTAPLTISKEILNTEARNFFVAYLQKYICDFDLPIIYNY